MPVMKNFAIPLLLLYCVLLSVVSTAQETPFTEYRIGPSDVLSITVWQQPELSRTVTVRPDGFITYPLLGDMQVASLTPVELRDLVAERLKEYVVIMISEVTVSVDAINSYTVSVMGEVNSPGRFSFQSQVTVIDVLAEAGGFTAFASNSRIIILRKANGVTQRIPFDYRRIERGRSTPEEMTVYPGDIIMVP
ncbi:MAG: polysaccharide biosynthesis/export family protein [Gammaproteobacteria bacterium]|nr:polysaccharide biosynthesis/export family protein [Gammaproteobacteria bacterium]MDP2140724.1 polysaccharide biosynthesis/export family protein [Gammaproteobacteria bacterium]MDP2346978.1 polysaccharide biosynthesis/export family protein [Gammaproteobacteria bacterium]